MKKELIVRPIRGEERQMWDQLMAAHHYLGLKQLVGESIRYVALFNGQWAALLGWTSAAYKSGPRDRWIGWDDDTRHKRLKFLANNSRFLMLPEVRVKNLASQILAANLKGLPGDWVKAYGHPVWLTETFIDPTRFSHPLCRDLLPGGWIYPFRADPRLSPQRWVLLCSRKRQNHFDPPFASGCAAVAEGSFFKPASLDFREKSPGGP